MYIVGDHSLEENVRTNEDVNKPAGPKVIILQDLHKLKGQGRYKICLILNGYLNTIFFVVTWTLIQESPKPPEPNKMIKKSEVQHVADKLAALLRRAVNVKEKPSFATGILLQNWLNKHDKNRSSLVSEWRDLVIRHDEWRKAEKVVEGKS